MNKIPVLKTREVCSVLENLGFKAVRQKGSHRQYKHEDGRFTTVPIHKGKDISPILLCQILRDIGLTSEDFLVGESLEV